MIEKHRISESSETLRRSVVVIAALLFFIGTVFGYSLRGLLPLPSDPTREAPLEYFGSSDPSWGGEDAKVTIIEFADFECYYCRVWYTDVYLRLKQEYRDVIRFVYRDYPLDFHADAYPSALAAECAKEQGKYWEYFDLLYGAPMGVTAEARQEYARRLGMDLQEFNSCVSSDRYAADIRGDMAAAARLGVQGTPAFFINGRMLSGAQPFENFQQFIEEELAK